MDNKILMISGQIVKWPKTSDRGVVLAVVDDQAKKVIFEKEGLAALPFRRGNLVRLYGNWEKRGSKNVFVLVGEPALLSDFTVVDLDTLAAYRLAGQDIRQLLEILDCRSMYQLYRCWLDDPAMVEAVAEENLGAAGREELVDFFRDLSVSTAVALLTDITGEGTGLKDAGLDLPAALRVVDHLKGRATRYKTTIAEMLLKDPWIIAQVEGIDFKYADHLAELLGCRNEDSPVRIYHAVVSILLEEAANGNSYLPDRKLTWRVKNRLGNKEDYPKFRRKMIDAIEYFKEQPGYRGKVLYDTRVAAAILDRQNLYVRDEFLSSAQKKEKGKISAKHRGMYLVEVFFSEKSAAEMLSLLCASPLRDLALGDALKRKALELSLQDGKPLDSFQQEALAMLARYRVAVWNGYAGTGKTYLAGLLIRAWKELCGEEGIIVTAPTGIAAARLQEAAKHPAATLHNILWLWRQDLADAASPAAPYLSRTKLVVVDEAGMMDVILLARLFYAVCGETVNSDVRFLFVGDDMQLGAVGPGNVLQVLKTLPGVGAAELEVLHRTGRAAKLAAFARDVREGRVAGIVPEPGRLEITNFPVSATPEDVAQAAVAKVKALLAAGVPAEDILILTPDRTAGREAGAPELNLSLRRIFNPEANASMLFWRGDRVICVRNDYRVEGRPVYNGTRGRVEDVAFTDETFKGDCKLKSVTVHWEMPDGSVEIREYYLGDAVRYLALAYALTVHKAQGCESPVVIYVDAGIHVWNRNVLYTAMTRAKWIEGVDYSGSVFFFARVHDAELAKKVEQEEDRELTRLEEIAAQTNYRYCHLRERVEIAAGRMPVPDRPERVIRPELKVALNDMVEIVAAAALDAKSPEGNE